MPASKYQKWHEAEAQAQEALNAVRAPSRSRKGWYPASPAAEEEAQRLRLEADRLFEEAMEEMHEDVRRALSKPVRQPRD